MVQDYKEIILSQDVLKNVTTTLGITDDIEEKITVEIPVDTRILSITVRDSDPNQAATLANTLRDEAAKKIIEVTKVSDVTTTLGITDDIKEKITVNIPVDTRILSISVRDSDPNQAATIANTLRDEAAKKIIEVTKVSDVTTLEAAMPAENPSTPQTKRNLVLGFIVCAFLATALVLILEVLDDRVKRPQDSEDALGLSLLGIVPKVNKLK